MLQFRLLILLVFLGQFVFGQKIDPKDFNDAVYFSSNDKQKYGFDAFDGNKAWENEYFTHANYSVVNTHQAYKIVGKNESDWVNFSINPSKISKREELVIKVKETGSFLKYQTIDSNLYELKLPEAIANYKVQFFVKEVLQAELFVEVSEPIVQKIRIVPLVKTAIKKEKLKRILDSLYQQANIQFEILIEPLFTNDELPKDLVLKNPSNHHDRFSDQMRLIRDVYIEAHPEHVEDEFLFFIVDGFVNESIYGYMVKNKALGFVRDEPSRTTAFSIAKQMGYGLGRLSMSWANNGPERGSTLNIMDAGPVFHMRKTQWDALRSKHTIYSFYDDYEDVKTNSGIIAYYFWKEDALGNIVMKNGSPLLSIVRPFKKNTFSYHLEINHFFYKTLFSIKGKTISLVHILAVILCFIPMRFIAKRFRRLFERKFKRPRFLKFMSRVVSIVLGTVLAFFSIGLVDLGYGMYEVENGKVAELKGKTMRAAISLIADRQHPKQLAASLLGSEVLAQNNGHYELKRRKRVLYFNVYQNAEKTNYKMRFIDSKDSIELRTKNKRIAAKSHYFVVRYKNDNDSLIKEELFNHLGVNLTEKMELKNPVERILVFVNGYRPTSLGSSVGENLSDIQNNGLEFPNSYNKIYTTDRFEYWHPWNEIDQLFKNRINPTNVFYADGHFSVSTSNYKKLVEFTKTSAIYPKRCKNPQRHVCYTTKSIKSKIFGTNEVKSYSLLERRSNKKGFNLRRKNGRIAGRNLLQSLNELPNKSNNDTLFIVAHSMGFAYALGMIDVLEGQIQLGSFYIIAPENASAGKIHYSKWKEVWQYGSNFNKTGKDAPCLQDGVAPQFPVNGLPKKCRLYFPKKLYRNKGFFDSHFIGYYTWVMDIPKGKPGHIQQR